MTSLQTFILITACLVVSACDLEANTPNTVPDRLENPPPAVPVPTVMGTSLNTPEAKTLPATSDVGEEGQPEIRPEPAELTGKEISWVGQKFGAPAFLRWEKNIRVMQYKSSHCVFDMFFYETGADRSLILKHFDARDPEGATLQPRQCIASLLPNHQWATGIDIPNGNL